MLAIVLTILVATAAGVAGERRFGRAASEAMRRIMLAVLFGLMPFVVFFNIAATEFNIDVGVGVVLAHLAMIITGTAAWVAGRVLGLTRPETGALICGVLAANTSYLGLPLTAALLGFDELPEAVVYDTLVSAPALLIGAFAVAAAFGTRAGDSARARIRTFFTRNPLLYAAAAGLLAPQVLAPDLLVDGSRLAVMAVLPVGFAAVGVSLSSEARLGNLPLRPRLSAPVAAGIGLRMAMMPGLLYLLALPLIDLPGPYLLLAAMPVGINNVILAHAYGLDLRLVSELIAWSTVVALVAALASIAS